MDKVRFEIRPCRVCGVAVEFVLNEEDYIPPEYVSCFDCFFMETERHHDEMFKNWCEEHHKEA